MPSELTPRERAEALGWTRSCDRWWVAGERVVASLSISAPGLWCVWLNEWTKWEYAPTEDAALAAALELRDVVLS